MSIAAANCIHSSSVRYASNPDVCFRLELVSMMDDIPETKLLPQSNPPGGEYVFGIRLYKVPV